MSSSHLLAASFLVCSLPGFAIAQVEDRRGNTIPGTEDVILAPNIDLSNRNEPNRNLQSAYVRAADLSGANFSNSWVDRSWFEANLENARFDNTSLTLTIFDQSDLSGTQFVGANLTDAAFEESNLAGANFTDAQIRATRFIAPANLTDEQIYSTASYKTKNMQGAVFAAVPMQGWDLSSIELEAATFSRLDLSGAHFSNANLQQATFYQVDLSRVDFHDAKISGVTFDQVTGLNAEQIYSTRSYANKSLGGFGIREVALSDIDFSDQHLVRASFRNSDLSRANFRGADLSGSSFQDSDIGQGDFSEANIQATTFFGRSKITSSMLYSTASYQSGDLTGIRLFDQDMSGWQLNGKNLAAARFDRSDNDGANYANANLSDAWFEESSVRNVDFSGADLTDIRFDRITSFQNANFNNAIIREAYFSGGNLSYEQLASTKSFAERDLYGIELNGTNLARGNFDNHKLNNATIIDANLSNSSFRDANLTGAAIIRSRIAGADFEGAVLHESYLEGSGGSQMSRAQFESTGSYQNGILRGNRVVGYRMDGWSFREQDLSDSSFYSANLRNADFTSADLTNVSFYDTPLRNANFDDAIVDGVDFSEWTRNPLEFSIQQLYPSRSYRQGHLRNMRFSEANLTDANFAGIDLTGTWFANAIIKDADFSDAIIEETTFSDSLTVAQLVSTKSYKSGQLLGIDFFRGDLSGIDLSEQDLSGSHFDGVDLAGVNLSNAQIEGVGFYLVGENASEYFRDIQLPSTKSFKERSLRGVGFGSNDLTGTDLSSFDLTNASFSGDLTGVDFTDAEIVGARFWGHRPGSLSAAQLYSTASYKRRDLAGIDLNEMRLVDWDFTDQDLARGDFEESTFIDSDFSDAFLVDSDFEDTDLIRTSFDRADLRNADDAWHAEQMGSNLIGRNGMITGLILGPEETFIVRDYPKPITIEQAWHMDPAAEMEFRIRSQDWGSTIAVPSDVTPQLDGTLRLILDEKANLSQLLGLKFDLFDWAVAPAEGNQFNTVEADANLIWDLRDLYVDGTVSLRGLASPLAGDFNADGDFSSEDIDLLSAAVRTGFSFEAFDLNEDHVVTPADRIVWLEGIANVWIGDANFDGEFNSSDFVEVFQANEYEDDLIGNSTWSTGDWDGDGEFGSSDLITAFQMGGYERGPRERVAIRSVPEPNSSHFLAFTLLSLAHGFRRSCQADESSI